GRGYSVARLLQGVLPWRRVAAEAAVVMAVATTGTRPTQAIRVILATQEIPAIRGTQDCREPRIQHHPTHRQISPSRQTVKLLPVRLNPTVSLRSGMATAI